MEVTLGLSTETRHNLHFLSASVCWGKMATDRNYTYPGGSFTDSRVAFHSTVASFGRALPPSVSS